MPEFSKRGLDPVMHVLYVHKNFPAQFGHIARHLVRHHGFECTFVSEHPSGMVDGIRRIQYTPSGGATRQTHFVSQSFENYCWHSHAVYEALKAHPEIRPDLVVGHSGFGSTAFLAELYDCPIINFFEFYYHSQGSDLDFRPEFMAGEMEVLRARARNAMLLLDLQTCTAGYCPTEWQRSLFPKEYQPKLETIFDGIDTALWYRRSPEEIGERVIAGYKIPRGAKVVTYCARGFEATRGFDIFMRIAKRICDSREDVVFVCPGTQRICYGGDLKHVEGDSFFDYVLRQDDYDLRRFIFPGLVPREELARILSMSDLHIYLTVPFVLSWSLMNALACECTVLASDTAPVQEMIQDGQNGLLVDFYDVDRFAERALEVLDRTAEFARLGQAGAKMIRDRYSLEQVLPQMLRLYERVCDQSPGRMTQGDGNASVGVHTSGTTNRPKKLYIHTLMAAPTGCEWVRVHQPMKMLAETYPDVRTVVSKGRMNFSLARPDEEKIFIWQRPIMRNPDSIPFLKRLLREGYKIVVEYDDDPRRRPEHLENDFFTFRACHAVQTTTEPLAQLLRQFNPNVMVFENQIAKLPPPRVYDHDGPVNVFFGAINREEDWKPIMPALNEAIGELGNNVHFRIVHDQQFFESLKTAEKDFTPFCSYERYHDVLRACDIAILPLSDTPSNRLKSDLKFLECVANGVAVLASPVVYGETIVPGKTGRLCKTPVDYRDGLIEFVRSPALRKDLAKNSRDYVTSSRMLCDHLQLRVEQYSLIPTTVAFPNVL